MILTPTYHVFDMFKVHQDATLLPTDLEEGSFSVDGDDLRAMNVSASKDAEGRIHVTIVNMDPDSGRTLTTQIRGASPTRISGRILSSSEMNAHNTFEMPHTIEPEDFNGARLNNGMLTVSLPAKSVVMLELQ
jgi:alpha-N-arabinofuranosidase